MKKTIKKAVKRPVKKPVKKARKTPLSSPRERRETNGGCKVNSAFMAPMICDGVLVAVVGEKPQPRPEIVSKLWIYIKNHNLQDMLDRRKINCDEKLTALFGKKSVTMFEIHKLLSGHLTKAK